MIAKKCDRCGELYEHEDIKICTADSPHTNCRGDYFMDLCEKCLIEFKDFMGGEIKKTKKYQMCESQDINKTKIIGNCEGKIYMDPCDNIAYIPGNKKYPQDYKIKSVKLCCTVDTCKYSGYNYECLNPSLTLRLDSTKKFVCWTDEEETMDE